MKRLIPDFRTSLQWLLLTFVIFACMKAAIGYAPFGGDIDQDQAAALALRNGVSIYGEDPIRLYQQYYSKEVAQENFHPPTTAILALPLTYWTPHAAFILCGILSLFLMLISYLIIWQEMGFSQKYKIGILSLFFFSYPVYSSIATAQISSLIVFLIVLSWYCFRHSCSRSEGILLGLAALIKIFPVLLFLFPAYRKNWLSLVYAISTFILGAGLTILLVGTNDCIQYFTHIAPRNIELYVAYPHNISINGMFASLLTNNSFTKPIISLPEINYLISLAASAIILMLSLLQLRAKILSGNASLGLSILVSAMILVTPISWQHILPIMFLCGIIALQAMGKSRTKRIALISCFLCFAFPDFPVFKSLLNAFYPEQIPWLFTLFIKLPTIGLLGFWLLLISQKTLPAAVNVSNS